MIVSDADIIEALQKYRGIVTSAAKQVGDVVVLSGAARQVVARDNLRDAVLGKLDNPTVEALWRV